MPLAQPTNSRWLRILPTLSTLTKLKTPSRQQVRSVIPTIAALVVGVTLLVIQSLVAAAPWLTRYATACWLADHVADYSRIASDLRGQEVQRISNSWSAAQTWDWQYSSPVDEQSPQHWIASGAHYVLLDERSVLNGDFAARLSKLSEQGAMLLYQSPPGLPFMPRQAVFWSFRPQHVLNLTFDNALQLVGYNLTRSADGQASLLLHWYTLKPPPADFHLFIHVLHNGEQPGTDMTLGGSSYPTSQWRLHELVFESVKLPVSDPAVRLRLGLYNFESGARLPMTTQDSTLAGDYIDFDPSS